MREIDQPHHAEDQRQAGGEQRVEAAEQNALETVSSQVMRQVSEIGARDGVARQVRRAAVSVMRPSMHAVDAVRDLERLRRYPARR